MSLPLDSVGWSPVCDFGISWSYSLTFYIDHLDVCTTNVIYKQLLSEGAIYVDSIQLTLLIRNDLLITQNYIGLKDSQSQNMLRCNMRNTHFFQNQLIFVGRDLSACETTVTK